MFNVVFIVPTGLGAEIGGHAGDATPASKLIASICDNLITHPNVVNASDINEMTDNTLYVEGSILDRFLEGKIALKKVRSNKILVVVNDPIQNETINAVSAARATIGLEAEIVVLNTELKMIAGFNEDGSAGGSWAGVTELIEQVQDMDFDALAINTRIEYPAEEAKKYLLETGESDWDKGINPWGGIEAIVSKIIANAIDKPVAHSPIENPEMKTFNEVVEPRKSAEMVSSAYLHCVLKGLHKAPQITMAGSELNIDHLTNEEVDALISPYSCWGRPHDACDKYNIPIIMVKENRIHKDVERAFVTDRVIIVDNYLEAVGVLMAMKEGISIESIRRPLKETKITQGNNHV